ncbi:hypothetical protein IE81DRAFT_349350 [Ceraceosorus guamensis]|uniref:Uncharacterized protein n=1 Tax=Ceraceosorus guamensis TaxID=1522189 RepID=A0A316VRT6_9BASI|nr:hypothetical protein IE81DRAFT_349350 [Ceraceosorus guamensis]PWN40316.1 hypothetical protein IE81DRAFT_349350 [Ceraceosorus guamensis]
MPFDPPSPTGTASLPMREVSLVSKRAQIRGAISALFAGMVTGLLCQRLLRVPSKYILANSLLAAGAAGYISARSELRDGLSELERSIALQRGHSPNLRKLQVGQQLNDDQASANEWSTANETRFEAGAGGMSEFVDRYATTRGDH